ncbi:MAG TPA: hypothetical protein VGL57_10330 [Solirubrobacteraceae bacterium]|jgi:hypothetical protein
MERGHFREADAWTRIIRVLGALTVGGLFFASTPAAIADTNFTWSDKADQGVPTWSTADNWESSVAPQSATAIGELNFPALTGVPCTFETPNEGCGYGSKNDVSGLSAESMNIDDGENYSIIGEPITLGTGGLSASPAAVTSQLTLSALALPITLEASQTWSIGGEGPEHLLENDLDLGGNVTGSTSALTVDLSNEPGLFLENNTEVGPVAIDGTDTSEAGIFNGAVEFFGELNSADDNPVSLNHIFFDGSGALGPLTTDSAELDIGSGVYPAESIEASSVELDSASRLGFEIAGAGVHAGEDYSQLTSHGAIQLGSAHIEVVVRPPGSGKPCPVLSTGRTYTFISTTAALSGSFSNAPEHSPEISIRFAEACKKVAQTMRISYHETGGTETVTGTVEAEAQERQEASERREEKEQQEAREHREANERQQTKEAETKRNEEAATTRKVEEEAIAAATLKRQGEEAAAAAAKKHQEEEAATSRGKEEPPAATGSVSLAGSTVTVQSTRAAEVKLTCTGSHGCSGQLTLTAKESKKTKTIGTVAFVIPAGKTATVRITLNATGKVLLNSGHGRLSAMLTILKSSPAPSRAHTEEVRLVQQKPRGRAER